MEFATKSTIAGICKAPISPSNEQELDWPKEADILNSEHWAQEINKLKLHKKGGIWYTSSNSIWIAPLDAAIQMRICVVGHFMRRSRIGYDASLKSIKAHIYWDSMAEDTQVLWLLPALCFKARGNKDCSPLRPCNSYRPPKWNFTFRFYIHRSKCARTNIHTINKGWSFKLYMAAPNGRYTVSLSGGRIVEMVCDVWSRNNMAVRQRYPLQKLANAQTEQILTCHLSIHGA